MDRQIIYPGAIPLETDLLNTNKYAMIALSKLAAAIFGTSTVANGLSTVPTSPASLQVYVNPGEIYALKNIDDSAYSSLAADTTHQILKQGVLLDQATLSCPAPATAGQSINYLIEATYTDVDSGATVLPYYNSSNPAVAYSGPANAGTAQNTVRKGSITLTAKAGTAATTGTQSTPAPDSGYVGLYVVTVANGQATIIAGNITQYASAPFINSGLLGLAPAFLEYVAGVTPPQFDATTKLATMAALQAVLGNLSGTVNVNNTSATLTLAQLGAQITFGGSTAARIITLPAIATIPSGKGYWIINQATVAVTLKANAAEVINYNNIGGTVGAANTLTLAPCDMIFIASSSGAAWTETTSLRVANLDARYRQFASVAVLSTSGTFTTPGNVTTSTLFKITLLGAGSGGGGGVASSIGGGGGAGGAFSFWITGLVPSTAYAYTVGAAGGGGVPGSNGYIGTATTITINGVTYTANPGLVGYGTGTPSVNLTSTQGTITPNSAPYISYSQTGNIGQYYPANSQYAGSYGGGTAFGGGGNGGYTGVGSGGNATGHGAGGGGGVGGSSGGAGSPGMVVIEY